MRCRGLHCRARNGVGSEAAGDQISQQGRASARQQPAAARVVPCRGRSRRPPTASPRRTGSAPAGIPPETGPPSRLGRRRLGEGSSDPAGGGRWTGFKLMSVTVRPGRAARTRPIISLPGGPAADGGRRLAGRPAAPGRFRSGGGARAERPPGPGGSATDRQRRGRRAVCGSTLGGWRVVDGRGREGVGGPGRAWAGAGGRWRRGGRAGGRVAGGGRAGGRAVRIHVDV